MKLQGDRRWAAWLTFIQTAVLDSAFTTGERLSILRAALQVEDEALKDDPAELEAQAVAFITGNRAQISENRRTENGIRTVEATDGRR